MNNINETLKKMEILKITINNLLYWDKVTYMPLKGNEFRGEVISCLSKELQSLYNSEEIKSFIQSKSNSNLEDTIKNKLNMKLIFSKIPSKMMIDYNKLIGQSEMLYDLAKEKNDFSIIKTNLKKIIDFQIKFSKIWNLGKHPYDSILKYYEPNISVEILDDFFEKLKVSIINILNSPDRKKEYFNIKEPLFRSSTESQKDFTKFILESIDFDFSRGRFDESHHPMTLANSKDDVRITTYFDTNDIRPCITTAFHEGGHGIYEQDIDSKLIGTLLAEASSMSLHESQAKFYENMIGKNINFWQNISNNFLNSHKELSSINIMSLYNSLNSVNPSLIRMDADELTYNLHIIIRYELERDLLSKKITIDNLEDKWNEKYHNYLGIVPTNVSNGILQDVHWFSGYWGYFPTYVIGNIYSAEIYEYLIKNTNILENLSINSLKKLHLWFRENIHKYGGTKSPEEILFDITNTKINPEKYIQYLYNKYITKK